MDPINYTNLLPLIILASAPIVSLLAISIYRNLSLVFWLALLSMILFMVSTGYSWTGYTDAYHAHEMLVIDRFALFYLLLTGGAGLAILLISYPYLLRQQVVKEEYIVLLQTAVFGAAVLVASNNFATVFLGLEILSISLYAIIAYVRTRLKAIEGGLKYLILAAASSAFLLFGMALIYTETGTLSFAAMGMAFKNPGLLVTSGLALMLVGIGFKLALVPFHTWTPDIYQGAPAPVSALIATISKGSIVAVLLRFNQAIAGLDIVWFVWALGFMAVASMLLGNILALRQDNIKRLLAYSSIAHLGYILIAILAKTELSVEAVTFYLVAYFISIIGAFGTLTLLSSTDEEIEDIEDLRGIFWKRPAISLIFSAMFFSLVGIPLTAGFIGKFYVVWAAISDGLWLLALVLVAGSVIGLYYYLRVINTMLSHREDSTPAVWVDKPPVMGVIVLSALGLMLFFLGVFPSWLIDLIQSIQLDL